jgi:hypothetical protein
MTQIDVRSHVGNQKQSRLVVLKMSPVKVDPKLAVGLIVQSRVSRDLRSPAKFYLQPGSGAWPSTTPGR